ncbi:MAG TPA: tRNA lysidine(34) synthetase TilS [Nitrospira sp.]|nr:tRNA lysidine(34) synthetase TilS [Nitrospira sp.]
MPVPATRTSQSRLLKQMRDTVRREQLFQRGQHLLVAASGGPDSTALLALLIELAPSWNLNLTAVHINYRLRGEESEADETFVADFCKTRHIPLVVLRPSFIRQRRRTSLQEMARVARYDAMKKLAGEIGADRIVLGHTANDQAETILMWMLRGAGLTGLAGMPFVRESLIVRPLLCSTRQDILAFLCDEGLTYREDSSNTASRYRRNRIRHELLPAMAAIVPAAIRILQRQAGLLREDERYLDKVARQQWSLLVGRDEQGNQVFNRQAVASLPTALQRRVVRLLLKTYESDKRVSSFSVVESVRRFILTGGAEASLRLRKVDLRRKGESICCVSERKDPVCPDEPVPVTIPSTVSWARTGAQFRVQLLSRSDAEPLSRQRLKHQAVFDADRFSTPLILRCWRAGDRMQPSGMSGRSKKLQDLFTDLKIPRDMREAIPVLVAPEGILWVAGLRQDERFLLREQSTRCLVVTMTDGLREGAR